MDLVALLNQIIENYHFQDALYEQMLALSRQSRELLQEGKWTEKLDFWQSNLNQRMQLSLQLKEYNSENRRLQEEAARLIGKGDFCLSKIKGEIPEDLYERLKKQINLIADKLALISSIDLESEKYLHLFVTKTWHKGDPHQSTESQAAGVYRQVMQQGDLIKKA